MNSAVLPISFHDVPEPLSPPVAMPFAERRSPSFSLRDVVATLLICKVPRPTIHAMPQHRLMLMRLMLMLLRDDARALCAHAISSPPVTSGDSARFTVQQAPRPTVISTFCFCDARRDTATEAAPRIHAAIHVHAKRMTPRSRPPLLRVVMLLMFLPRATRRAYDVFDARLRCRATLLMPLRARRATPPSSSITHDILRACFGSSTAPVTHYAMSRHEYQNPFVHAHYCHAALMDADLC